MRQKDESQDGSNKKTMHAKFSKKTNISYPLIRTRTLQPITLSDKSDKSNYLNIENNKN